MLCFDQLFASLAGNRGIALHGGWLFVGVVVVADSGGLGEVFEISNALLLFDADGL